MRKMELIKNMLTNSQIYFLYFLRFLVTRGVMIQLLHHRIDLCDPTTSICARQHTDYTSFETVKNWLKGKVTTWFKQNVWTSVLLVFSKLKDKWNNTWFSLHVCDLADLCRQQANLRTTNTEWWIHMMDGGAEGPEWNPWQRWRRCH